MSEILLVWDGYGGLMGAVKLSEYRQVKLALEEMCEEWFEHCRGELESFTREDFDKLAQTSVCGNLGLNVTHILPLKSGDEIEVGFVQVRDYSHYEVEE